MKSKDGHNELNGIPACKYEELFVGTQGILISQFQIEFDVLYLTFTGGNPTSKNRDIALILLERPMEGMVDMVLSYFAPPIGAEVKMAGTGWKINKYINKSIDSFPLI